MTMYVVPLCRGKKTGVFTVGVLAMLMSIPLGCSDNSSDPEAITVGDLKYPSGLSIQDLGNGKVELSWLAANNEGNFDGYNVYGIKGKAADLGVEEGKAIELLDDKGEVQEAARTTLGNFDYDPKGNKISAKAAAAATAEGEAPKFSARPIHQLNAAGDKKLLPTCKTKTESGVATCVLTTEENLGKDVDDDKAYAVNGRVTFAVPDVLEVGESYCFFVLSSMGKGEKVSQTSSNVACIIPEWKANDGFDVTLPLSSSSDSLKFDLTAWRKNSCTNTTDSRDCSDPGSTYITTDTTTKSHKPDAVGPLYIEYVDDNGQAKAAFVAGKGHGIADLGYYTGFSDSTVPVKAPTIVVDINQSGSSEPAPILNKGSYSIAGQSIPVVEKHMYIIAVPEDLTASTLKYHYYWIYVSSISNGVAKFEMRLPKDAV